jgi:predicted nucleotidyltransferase
MRELAERLHGIPGVAAVTLGGSRATGNARSESDWDFGLYYRGRISADDVRALGFEGEVVEPGEWGRLVNGGASLTVDGQRVDLLYRDLDVVEHWVAEAEAGRYEVDRVEGYVAGMATYVLAGELALAEVLAGELPARVPGPLRESAPPAGGRARHSRSASRRRSPGAATWPHVSDCCPRR